ncbi:hypothetical protein ON010_g11632 [Phytophthora cinnamomi]|nr:hypothetical protein ON010_g11632 [Phytophthora cinnamomi]
MHPIVLAAVAAPAVSVIRRRSPLQDVGRAYLRWGGLSCRGLWSPLMKTRSQRSPEQVVHRGAPRHWMLCLTSEVKARIQRPLLRARIYRRTDSRLRAFAMLTAGQEQTSYPAGRMDIGALMSAVTSDVAGQPPPQPFSKMTSAEELDRPSWATVPCVNPREAPLIGPGHAYAVRKDSLAQPSRGSDTQQLGDPPAVEQLLRVQFRSQGVVNRPGQWRVSESAQEPLRRDLQGLVLRVRRIRWRQTPERFLLLQLLVDGNAVTQNWTNVFVNAGQQPTPRYGHAAVVYGKCSTWSGLRATRSNFSHYDRESMSSRSSSEYGRLDSGRHVNDMHSFNLDSNTWTAVAYEGSSPKSNASAGCVNDGSLFVLSDHNDAVSFKQMKLPEKKVESKISEDLVPDEEGTAIAHLRSLVNNQLMSDVTFIVEGAPVFGHKSLCVRCNYFKAMFTGEMLESTAAEVEISDVSRTTFLSLLEYVYTDRLAAADEDVKDLFVAADRSEIANAAIEWAPERAKLLAFVDKTTLGEAYKTTINCNQLVRKLKSLNRDLNGEKRGSKFAQCSSDDEDEMEKS